MKKLTVALTLSTLLAMNRVYEPRFDFRDAARGKLPKISGDFLFPREMSHYAEYWAAHPCQRLDRWQLPGRCGRRSLPGGAI